MPITYKATINSTQHSSSEKVVGQVVPFAEDWYNAECVQDLHHQVQIDVRSMEQRLVTTMESLIAQGRGFEIWQHVLEWSQHLTRVDLRCWAPGF